jgi:hypothetical protein
MKIYEQSAELIEKRKKSSKLVEPSRFLNLPIEK